MWVMKRILRYLLRSPTRRPFKVLSYALGLTLLSGVGHRALAVSSPSALPYSGIGPNGFAANWTAPFDDPGGSTYTGSLSNNFGVLSTFDTGGLTSVGFASLTPNTTYFVKVRIEASPTDVSLYTDLGPIVTLANSPQGATITDVQTTQCTGTWNNNGNGNPTGTSYIAQVSLQLNFATIVGSAVGSANGPATITGLTPNTPYFFRAVAVNFAGVQSASIATAFTTLASQPGTSAYSAIGTNQVTANWTANGNPAGTTYTAQISLSSTFATVLASSSTKNTFATFSGLTSNTSYFVRVQAPSSAFTLLGQVNTNAFVPLPAAFSAVTTSQIQANWAANGNPNGTSYKVILSLSPSPSTNNLPANQTQTTTNTFFNFSSLSTNTVYYVDVQAAASSFATLGSTATLASAPAAAALSNVQATQLTANWTANGNPAGTSYLAQYSTDAGFAAIGGNFPTTALTATISGLAPNQQYFTRVQAINASGIATAFTTLPSTITLAAAPLAAAYSGVTISQLTANWTANGNPAGTTYLAQLSTDPGFSTIADFHTTSGFTSATMV